MIAPYALEANVDINEFVMLQILLVAGLVFAPNGQGFVMVSDHPGNKACHVCDGRSPVAALTKAAASNCTKPRGCPASTRAVPQSRSVEAIPGPVLRR